LETTYPYVVAKSDASVKKALTPNKIGSKSKNTAFKAAEQILEADLKFRLRPYAIVFWRKWKLLSNHSCIAFFADLGKPYLLLMQNLAPAHGPDMGRAKVGAVPVPLELVHHMDATLRSSHFLLQPLLPNQ
jgi:hypothetical protein